MEPQRKRPAPAATGRGDENEHGQALSLNRSTASPADALLPRLDRVRETGPGRWLSRCPAHDDRTPSLTVRETSDGTLLIHCWAGCAAAEVVTAAGLELRDLFPDQAGRGPLRRGERWVPADVLRAVAGEATVVALAASDIVAGRPLTTADRDRVQVAAGRLRTAAREVGCNV